MPITRTAHTRSTNIDYARSYENFGAWLSSRSFSLTIAAALRNWIIRELNLADNEFRLMMAVWDRTLGWAGSDRSRIMTHFPTVWVQAGIRDFAGDLEEDRNQTPIWRGTGSSKATVNRVLKQLEDRRLIIRYVYDDNYLQKNKMALGINWPLLRSLLHTFREFELEQSDIYALTLLAAREPRLDSDQFDSFLQSVGERAAQRRARADHLEIPDLICKHFD